MQPRFLGASQVQAPLPPRQPVMRVYVVISAERKVMACMSCAVDAHVMAKASPGATVSAYMLNAPAPVVDDSRASTAIPPCQSGVRG